MNKVRIGFCTKTQEAFADKIMDVVADMIDYNEHQDVPFEDDALDAFIGMRIDIMDFIWKKVEEFGGWK